MGFMAIIEAVAETNGPRGCGGRLWAEEVASGGGGPSGRGLNRCLHDVSDLARALEIGPTASAKKQTW